MLSEKRQAELLTLWKRFRYGMTNITSLYFFPSILGAVVFSVYIAMGKELDLSVAFTVTTIFNLIKVMSFVRLNTYIATTIVASFLYRTSN